MEGKKTASTRIGSALLVILFLIIITEVLLRAFFLSPSATVYDKDLEWIYKPGSVVLQSSEGYGRFRMNSHGWNDEEGVNPDYKRTVLLMGDSYTEALQVARQDNFSSITERLTCTNIFNSGRANMTLPHYYVLSRRFQSMAIDEAVIAFSGGDVDDLKGLPYQIVRSPESNKIMDIELTYREERSPIRIALKKISEYSALATLLRTRVRVALMDSVAAERVEDQDDDNQSKEFSAVETSASGLIKVALTTRPDPEGNAPSEIEEVFTYYLSKINDTIPLKILFIPDYNYYSFGRAVETSKSTSTSAFIEQIANRLGIPFKKVSGLDAFYQENLESPIGFANSRIGGGHLNEVGHSIVARAMSDLLGSFCGRDSI